MLSVLGMRVQPKKIKIWQQFRYSSSSMLTFEQEIPQSLHGGQCVRTAVNAHAILTGGQVTCLASCRMVHVNQMRVRSSEHTRERKLFVGIFFAPRRIFFVFRGIFFVPGCCAGAATDEFIEEIHVFFAPARDAGVKTTHLGTKRRIELL